MIEEVFEEAVEAASRGDWQEVERLVSQLASSPHETIAVAVKALQQVGHRRQELAIKIIRVIGYPANEPAIAELIYHIGDPNVFGWKEAVATLAEMGPDVVVPHLVRALLEPGEPYHKGTWTHDVDGICLMLSGLDKEYARRCCPAVNYLLSQNSPPAKLDVEYLLDVVERAGNDQDYVLPTLLSLTKRYAGTYIEELARSLISSYTREALGIYGLLLNHAQTGNGTGEST